jgi:TatD DNase family protein
VIDSHCHLASEDFAVDLSAVVDRARAAGLTGALCIVSAGDEAESARAAEVRSAWPAVRFATGIHPHQAGGFAGDIDRAVATVRQSLSDRQACAIGEIGLDYHYDFSPRDVQHEVFRAQLRLARELRLPIVIHTREATDDTFRMLQEETAGSVRGVFHCFTGDEAMARAALEIDFHVSFAGIVTFPRAESVRGAAKIVPADRVLAETDAPYLAPVPHRCKRNEPAFVARVIERLAEVRGTTAAELAAQVTRNFEALFGGASGLGSPVSGLGS